MATKPMSNVVAGAIVSVFGLLFVCAGLCLVYPPMYRDLFPHERDLLFDNGAAFLFCCGAGFFWAALTIAFRTSGDPATPWLTNPDWVEGRIFGRGGWGNTRRRWVFALIICYFAGFLVWAFATNYHQADDTPLPYKALLGVILPAWALFLLFRTIAATSRTLHYGQSSLILENGIPGPGTAFSARIECHVDQQLEPTFFVSLVCFEAITTYSRSSSSSSSGDSTTSSRTEHYERWRDEYECAGLQAPAEGGGCTIPVRFDLPQHALQSILTSTNHVEWILTVTSTLPGFIFEDRFEVPVYRGAPARATDLRELPTRRDVARQPVQGRVLMSVDGDVLTVTYPPAMETGKALFATYCLVLSLIIAVMCVHDQAWLGMAGCTAVAVLSLYGAARLWLMSTTVIARTGSLTLRRDLLGKSWIRDITVTPETILAVDQKVLNNDSSFRLSIFDQQKWLKIGCYLEHKSEATTILDRIRKQTGIVLADVGQEAPECQSEAETEPVVESDAQSGSEPVKEGSA